MRVKKPGLREIKERDQQVLPCSNLTSLGFYGKIDENLTIHKNLFLVPDRTEGNPDF